MTRSARNRTGRTSIEAAQKPVRVAIYCRKSSHRGLKQEFTSLDVQREYVVNYIQSRRGQGWAALPTAYDDGGFSGADTARPAFQRLIEDVTEGKVDVVAVYKIDRLTRSLSDFVRIIELLEQHDVSFVSVTESLNTADGLGRMILSILAIFAEFERDRIRERTMDKKRLARRKGYWPGGRPILGYDLRNRALVVNEREAERVRWIFDRYLEIGSQIAVSQECNRKGWKTKSYTAKSGRHYPGSEFNHAAIQRTLANPLYLGKIRDGEGGLLDGQHDAIIDPDTWDKAQRLMNRNAPGLRVPALKHDAFLCGLVWCGVCGRKMYHKAYRKQNRVYRIYHCSGKKQKGATACDARPVNAALLEQFVVERIQEIGKDPKLVAEAVSAARAEFAAKKPELVAELQRFGQRRKKLEEKQDRLTQAIEAGQPPKAVIAKLKRLETEIEGLDAEVERVRDELQILKTEALDERDLGRALAEFRALWEVLVPAERARILQLLAERVVVDSPASEVSITFRPNGIQLFAKERTG